MLNVTLIAVGGLKEDYFAGACAEYQKRLGAFCRLNVVETRERDPGRSPDAAGIEKCLALEGKAILEKLPPKAFTVALCVEGKSITSEALAEKLESVSGLNSHIAFIVGSSHGLSEEVKRRADFLLSMSAMTFPHRLARVMLLEQLYRAFSIIGGMKYHK